MIFSSLRARLMFWNFDVALGLSLALSCSLSFSLYCSLFLSLSLVLAHSFTLCRNLTHLFLHPFTSHAHFYQMTTPKPYSNEHNEKKSVLSPLLRAFHFNQNNFIFEALKFCVCFVHACTEWARKRERERKSETDTQRELEIRLGYGESKIIDIKNFDRPVRSAEQEFRPLWCMCVYVGIVFDIFEFSTYKSLLCFLMMSIMNKTVCHCFM